MSRIRNLVVMCAAMAALVCLSAEAQAVTLDVTALPLPNAACPGAVNAVPNDSTSDQSAFNCAVALIPAGSHGTIVVPSGTFNLTAAVSVVDKNVAIRGEGQRISRLVWNHAGDGLYFQSTHTTLNYTLAVRSLSLFKSTTSGGAAIRAIWDRASTHWDHGIITTVINDVHIGTDPWPSGSAYWYYGIQLQNSTTAKISMFNIQGSSATNGIAAIQIHGTNAAGKSIGAQIRNGTVMKYVRGIEAKDHAEGIHVQEVTMREVGWGIQMTTGQGTSLSNNYISARNVGIELSGVYVDGERQPVTNVSISNNLIEQFEDQNFIGVLLSNTDSIRVSSNTVRSGGGAQPRNGIIVQGVTSHPIIEGNITSLMNTGIWITNTFVNFGVITGNNNRNASVTPILDWGSPGANYFAHNH